MQLPIAFPNHEDVIREEVARFRTQTPEEQIASLDEMFQLYHALRTASGKPEMIDRVAEREESLNRQAILEFAGRHAR